MKKPITIFFFVAILVLLAVIIVLVSRTPPTHHTVLLTDEGFSPSKLEINLGDFVTFQTARGEQFWPASDLHPTHGVYDDFDPKRPITLEDSWEFKFTKPGEWKYHDHLFSIFKGTITVRNKEDVAETPCTTKQTPKCWQEAVLSALKAEGVESAFNTIGELYNTSSLFAADCHGFAHLIGEETYMLFSEGEDFKLSLNTSTCGYGFYHGFMETLLLSSGDVLEAQEFCKEVDEQLSGERSSASTACYHGIGHGAVDGSDPSAWGNFDSMIDPGIKFCEFATQTFLQKYLCMTGVFNSVEILSTDPKYRISYIHDDPYAVCEDQPDEWAEACYTNMIPAVLRHTKSNYTEAMKYIHENITKPELITVDGYKTYDLVMLGLAHDFTRANITNKSFTNDAVEFCRKNEEARLSCFEGIAFGNIVFGTPESSHFDTINFCSNDALEEDERDACFGYFLSHIRNWLNDEESRLVCALVEKEYEEKYCVF